MKLKTLALMGVICTAAVFTSCKKDDDDKKEETPASVEGTWKMSAFTVAVVGGGMDTTWNEYADMAACEKDDLTRFNADKTVTELAGATKCNASEPDSESGGTWSLSSDNKKITITDGTAEVYDVVTLNATTLQIKSSETDMGVTYTANITMARQ